MLLFVAVVILLAARMFWTRGASPSRDAGAWFTYFSGKPYQDLEKKIVELQVLLAETHAGAEKMAETEDDVRRICKFTPKQLNQRLDIIRKNADPPMEISDERLPEDVRRVPAFFKKREIEEAYLDTLRQIQREEMTVKMVAVLNSMKRTCVRSNQAKSAGYP
jgi:hypothetical protein